MSFILASTSPRRLELLEQIGRKPRNIEPADIDETPKPSENPRAYVRRMAAEKASAIYNGFPVLAADTAVILGQNILGKPKDEAQAREFLQKLSGRRHQVISAVALYHNQEIRVKDCLTRLKFQRLENRELDAYIASKEWQGKAGGYAIQGLAGQYIPWISGSYSNVVGLPLYETQILFKWANL